MSYSTQGASNRQIYDCCAYAQTLQQSVDPLQYDLYFGAVENCNKCIDKKAWFKQDKEIIDIESDLWNITRPLTKCDGYKYNPNCKTGPNCVSTFDPTAPRILSPSLCPIVYNNIPIQTNPGYTVPDPANICLTKNDYRKADDVNTFEQWSQSNKAILGNNADPQNVFMFMNSCANKPLYNGEIEKVNPYMLDTYDSARVNFNPSSKNIPFPRMGYDLDQSTSDVDPAQKMMFKPNLYSNSNPNANFNSKKEQSNNMPSGMRLPISATKGKMGINPNQLFDSDNESIYDSDGEYDSI